MKHYGIWRNLLFLIAMTLASAPALANDDQQRGKLTGGKVHALPDWFKESFLEIADDIEEAGESGKHVMLFFDLNGCPYCDRMLEESFSAEPLGSYIRENFDVIAINIQGDRDVAFNEEITVTEKELASILKVRATPALMFMNTDNETILRVNGYRAPERFRTIMEYVATRSYQTTSLADYLQAELNRNVYQLRDNPLFSDITDLSSVDGPLMVIFEDGSCYDCNEFHDGILADERVRKEVSAFTVVRLDTDSAEPITDLYGKKTTAAALAREYEMIYRPGVLVFDEGNLIKRYDSLTFPHHFKEGLRYVSGGYYQQTDYRTYSEQRTEELLSSGVDIDLGSPKQ